jgi:hypothetical protein
MLHKQPQNADLDPARRLLQFLGLDGSQDKGNATANNRPTKEPEDKAPVHHLVSLCA